MKRRTFLQTGLTVISALYFGVKTKTAVGRTWRYWNVELTEPEIKEFYKQSRDGSLSVYRIDDGEVHHFIATSENDAIEQLDQTYEFDCEADRYYHFAGSTVERLNDDFVLSFKDADAPEDGPELYNSCRGWCQMLGRGCLCSTCY